MAHKKYWLRGIGVGIIVYLVVVITLVATFLISKSNCNAFVTVGPVVEDSILCQPIIILVATPLMILTELFEDIIGGFITHPISYFILLVSILIYLGIFASFGIWYGKRKNNV